MTLPSGEALVAADAASGDEHAAAIAVSASGAREVYTWGRGADGALGHGGVADEPAPRLVAALRGREGRCVACGPRTTAAVVAPRALTTKEKAELAKAPVTFAAAAPAEKKKISRPASRPESSSRAASRAPSQAPSRVASSLDLRNLSEAPLEGRGGTHSRDANKNPNPSPPLGAAEARWRDSAASASSARVVSDAALRRARAEALAATRERDALREEVAALREERERRTLVNDASGGRSDEDARRERDALRAEVARLREALLRKEAGAREGGTERDRREEEAAEAGAAMGEASTPTIRTTRAGSSSGADSGDAPASSSSRRGGGGGGGGGAAKVRAAEAAAEELRARAEALEERVVLAEFELAGARAERRGREEAEEAEERRSPARAPAEGAAAAGTTTTTTTTTTKTTPPPPPPPPLAPLAADTRGHLHVSVGAASSAISASSESSAALGGGGESPADVEWVEEPEEGVFLTVAADRASGAHVLRRVRFSRKKFAAEEANEWWGKNRARVMKTRGLKVQRS